MSIILFLALICFVLLKNISLKSEDTTENKSKVGKLQTEKKYESFT